MCKLFALTSTKKLQPRQLDRTEIVFSVFLLAHLGNQFILF
jgi:hypothetical protein